MQHELLNCIVMIWTDPGIRELCAHNAIDSINGKNTMSQNEQHMDVWQPSGLQRIT
jgi:hypothetical protein